LGNEISLVWKMDDEAELARLAQALKLVKDLKSLGELEEKLVQMNKDAGAIQAKIAKEKEEESELHISIDNLLVRQNDLQNQIDAAQIVTLTSNKEVKLNAATGNSR